MLNAYVVSIIRTGVPGLVGWIAAWLVANGIGVSDATKDWAVTGMTFGFLMVYYIVVRFVEQKAPQFGWLLGVPVKPVYPTPPGGLTKDDLPTAPTPPVQPA